jgi:hypothetical protein
MYKRASEKDEIIRSVLVNLGIIVDYFGYKGVLKISWQSQYFSRDFVDCHNSWQRISITIHHSTPECILLYHSIKYLQLSEAVLSGILGVNRSGFKGQPKRVHNFRAGNSFFTCATHLEPTLQNFREE